MRNNIILELYKKPQTVFTFKELSLLFPDLSYQSLKDRLKYAVDTGKLKRLRRGIYVKDNYNPFELANKIYTPSYISLETVLQKEGVIFQEYETIFVVSYLTRMVLINGLKVYYRKIKEEVLVNKEGIREENGYYIATKERAFLDAIFLYKNYHFDNLGVLDWNIVKKLVKIYKSRKLKKRVMEYYKIFREEDVG